MKRYLYVLILIIHLFAFGVSDVIYVDESGIDTHYQREYGYAAIGEKIQDTKRGRKYRRTNLIAGLWGKKHLAVQCYSHTTTSTFFEDWFEFELIGLLPENALIILDNASFHRKRYLCKIAAKYGMRLLFLPPYSPDLNPIEKSWANLKRWFCDHLHRFPCFDFALDAYFHAYHY